MNRDDLRARMTYLIFCELVAELLMRRRCSVISWWRTTARNAAVGGVPYSRHLTGCAADLVPDQDEDRAAVIRDARALGLQVDASKSIHIELDPL
jgi:hypothetical protein